MNRDNSRFHIVPGAASDIAIALDTGQIPSSEVPTLSGGQVSKQVWVYAEGDDVHPYAILEMRGRITQGVSFAPAVLEFGSVSQAKGTVRTITASIDADLYQGGQARLSSSDPAIRVEPVERDSVSQAHGPTSVSGGGAETVVRSFRVIVPPDAPIGPLSGVLTMKGMKRGGAAVSSVAGATLPFAGRVVGPISAQPGMCAFGLVRDIGGATRAAAAENARLRTRWVLLAASAPRPAKLPKGVGAAPSQKGIASPGTWTAASVQSDNSVFRPVLIGAGKPVKKEGSTGRGEETPPLPYGLSAESACWLRVTLSDSAPHNRTLTANLLVTLADGKRLRVPVLAQRE